MGRGKTVGMALAAPILLGIAYLAAWPVPTSPVAFEAPPAPEPVQPDVRLTNLERLPLDGRSGPEDVALGPDGHLYAAVLEGEVLRRQRDGTRWETFVRTEGRPLGLVFDHDDRLLVADPYRGLLRVSPDSSLQTLIPATADAPAGTPSLCYANNVDIAPDGTIFLTDSTQRFCPPEHGGTFEASLHDITEHRRTGRLLAFHEDSGALDVIMDDLQFANGTAVSEDGRYVLVVETGDCRVWRYDRQLEERTLLLEGLPGFPDNLTRGLHGRFWLGFTKPRSAFLDNHAGRPWVRRLVARLPRALYPVPPSYSHILAIDVNGQVVERHQDPAGGYPEATGATESGKGLYVHSLTAPELGFLPNPARAQ